MSVAWQFTAWNDAKEKAVSQRRYDFVRCEIRSPSHGREQKVEPLSCRTPTGRNAFSNGFQADVTLFGPITGRLCGIYRQRPK